MNQVYVTGVTPKITNQSPESIEERLFWTNLAKMQKDLWQNTDLLYLDP